jgi:hypothetical protein
MGAVQIFQKIIVIQKGIMYMMAVHIFREFYVPRIS